MRDPSVASTCVASRALCFVAGASPAPRRRTHTQSSSSRWKLREQWGGGYTPPGALLPRRAAHDKRGRGWSSHLPGETLAPRRLDHGSDVGAECRLELDLEPEACGRARPALGHVLVGDTERVRFLCVNSSRKGTERELKVVNPSKRRLSQTHDKLMNLATRSAADSGCSEPRLLAALYVSNM